MIVDTRSLGIRIILAVLGGFGLFIGAIIIQNFWISLLLGIAGAACFALALVLLRDFRRNREALRKGKPADRDG